jgi:hypothetical protein
MPAGYPPLSSTYYGKLGGWLPDVYFLEDWKKLSSPKFHLEDDKSRATRILYTAWADLWNAQVNLLGISIHHPAGGSGWIQRIPPFGMPASLFTTSSGAKQLFCTQVDGEGTGLPHTAGWPNNPSVFFPGAFLPTKQGEGADAVSTYQWARLTCQFEQLPYDILSDGDMLALVGTLDESYCVRYVERQYNPESTYYTMDKAFFEWFEAGTIAGDPAKSATQRQIPTGAGITLPYADCVFKWLKVPELAVPFATIDATFGCTNDAIFPPNLDFVGNPFNLNPPNFAAETLVLTGGKTIRKRDSFGNRIVDIEYAMRFYPLGANKIFSIADGKPVKVRRAGSTANGVYPKVDFRALFKPAT